MNTCPGCGGIVGRDCFNVEECMWIDEQQERQKEAKMHEAMGNIQKLAHENIILIKALKDIMLDKDKENIYKICRKALKRIDALEE